MLNISALLLCPCPYAGGGERHNSCHRLVTCCRMAASSVLLWCLNSSLEARVAGAAARSSTVAQHHPLAGDDGCWRLHEAGGDGERCTILGTLSCEAPGWPPPASTDVTTTTVHTTQPTVARLLLCGRISTLSSHSSTFSNFLMYCILYNKLQGNCPPQLNDYQLALSYFCQLSYF